MKAPLIVFVYNRVEHTRSTLEGLSNNELAKDTELYIFSDAPKTEKDNQAVSEVRTLIEEYAGEKRFKNTHIILAERNKGLANSIISGVTSVISQHGKAIVVEDDLTTSPVFLRYMNDALDYYQEDKKVGSISGYSGNIKMPKHYVKDVYFTYRGCSWGWATWKDRWEVVDWDVKDYENLKTNRRLKKRMNACGYDLLMTLERQMQGKIDSWAVRWCYSLIKRQILTVYPVHSLVKNSGIDGSGTHCSSCDDSHYDTSLWIPSLFEFCEPYVDKRILRSFSRFYMPFYVYARRRIKGNILNIVHREK